MGAGSSRKQVKALQKLRRENIPHLVKNKSILAKVTDCHDGDTCTIAFLIGKYPGEIDIRLLGIDAAEMPRRKDGSDRTPEELELAYAARDFLKERILDQCIHVDLHDWDKWGGRVLGTVYCVDKNGTIVGKSLNDQLVDTGLAVVYTGGKKDTDWNLVYENWKNKDVI